MTETELELMAALLVQSADLRALGIRIEQLEALLTPQHPTLAESAADFAHARRILLHETLLGLERRQPALAARLIEKIEASYPDLRF